MESKLDAMEAAAAAQKADLAEVNHKHKELTTEAAELRRQLAELERHVDAAVKGAVKPDGASGLKKREVLAVMEALDVEKKLLNADAQRQLNILALFADELQVGNMVWNQGNKGWIKAK
jgi:chromosome segregation ATPase